MARERELTLMVGHTFEYSAPVLKIREIIKSGELGDIFYVSSVRANLGLFQRDVNVTWDLATHDISIILMLLEQMPMEVSCHAQSHYRKNVEDVAMLTLRFPNNVIAFVHVSWLDPNKIRRATIVGSRKMLVYDDTALQEKIRVYDKGVTHESVLRHLRRFPDVVPLRRCPHPAHRRARAAEGRVRALRGLHRRRAARPRPTGTTACAWCRCWKPASVRCATAAVSCRSIQEVNG